MFLPPFHEIIIYYHIMFLPPFHEIIIYYHIMFLPPFHDISSRIKWMSGG